jgi:hypothetical protein
MSRKAQKIYVKLQDKIKSYLDNYNEDAFYKKYNKEKLENIRKQFVGIGTKLRTQMTHDLGTRLDSKYKLK